MFLLFWATRHARTYAAARLRHLDRAARRRTCSVLGGERLAAVAGILLFIGACGKTAQIPLYVWLPDAMAGPTPVSALIHAATMVTAGVYMVCRHVVPLSRVDAGADRRRRLVGAADRARSRRSSAFAQTDIKKVLAYSTVRQLGFMFVARRAPATGSPAIFHLVHARVLQGVPVPRRRLGHARHGARRLETPATSRRWAACRSTCRITRSPSSISCLAIAGIFPFAGFFSKDEILGGVIDARVADGAAGHGSSCFFTGNRESS